MASRHSFANPKSGGCAKETFTSFFLPLSSTVTSIRDRSRWQRANRFQTRRYHARPTSPTEFDAPGLVNIGQRLLPGAVAKTGHVLVPNFAPESFPARRILS